MEAVSDPGNEIIYAWRSFEAYPQLADLAGATSVPIPLREETHDLAAMAAAITPRTRMILVCNPNNPTGTAVRERELIDFIDRVPADCLVVLDEAYHEYVRDPSVPDGINLYRDRPNVAVLRTFSKAYGLAGLRVGFLVGHEPVAEAVRKTMLTFTVNSVAQAAAVASLNAEDELLERVENVVKERHRVSEALRADGWTVPETEANFVWLRLGDRTTAFAQACEAVGIAVRPFEGEGARVSIGTPAANDAFLAVARAFPAPALALVADLMLLGADVSAEGAQPLLEGGVPAVDVVAVGDHGLALGGHAREDKGRAAAQVGRHDIRPVQLRRAVHDRDVVVELDLGAHLVQLGHQGVPAVEDGLADVAGALGHRRQRHDRRLQVGREARVRAGDHVDRAQRLLPAHLEHRAVGGELHAHLLKLPADDAEVVKVARRPG